MSPPCDPSILSTVLFSITQNYLQGLHHKGCTHNREKTIVCDITFSNVIICDYYLVQGCTEVMCECHVRQPYCLCNVTVMNFDFNI